MFTQVHENLLLYSYFSSHKVISKYTSMDSKQNCFWEPLCWSHIILPLTFTAALSLQPFWPPGLPPLSAAAVDPGESRRTAPSPV